MPRFAYRLTLANHLTPGEQRLVMLLLHFVNQIRTDLGLPVVTEAEVLAQLRTMAQQRVAEPAQEQRS